jgi:hypothetical protein
LLTDSEIYITKETYDKVLAGARESIDKIDTVSLLVFPNKDVEFGSIDISSSDIENKKSFWANLVDLVVNKKVKLIDERKKTVSGYVEFINLFEDYDLTYILFCSENATIMVCDDQFIRYYGYIVNPAIKSTNLVGFLYSTKSITMSNMIDLQSKLCDLL